MDRVGDTLCSVQEKCEDWLERHPTAKHTARVVAGVVLVAGVIALTGLVWWACFQGEPNPPPELRPAFSPATEQ